MGSMTETSAALTPRDILTGHLAALIPGQPQAVLEAAADGLSTLGYRHLDPESSSAVLGAHIFTIADDGDGWNEPRNSTYSCSCGPREYASWIQHDPELSGLLEFQTEGYDKAIALHHAHVTEMLTDPAPVASPEPAYVPALTEDAIVRATNQLRSQLGDFTTPDVLMRKRARMVLIAAIRGLAVERA